MTSADLTKIIRYMTTLKDRRPEYRYLLDWWVLLYSKIAQSLPSVVLPAYQVDHAENKLAAGFPLFPLDQFPVDQEAAYELMLEFADEDGPGQEIMKALSIFLKENRAAFVQSIKRYLENDQAELSRLAESAGLAPELWSWLIGMALIPSFWTIRALEGPRLTGRIWEYGHCPLCGSLPRLARLEKDGGRVLGCSRCGQEWSFPRLKCPYCLTEKQTDLYYLSVDHEGYRIQACRQCRGYLKTVDSRVFEETSPLEVEDLVTMHLDLIAADQGLIYPDQVPGGQGTSPKSG